MRFHRGRGRLGQCVALGPHLLGKLRTIRNPVFRRLQCQHHRAYRRHTLCDQRSALSTGDTFVRQQTLDVRLHWPGYFGDRRDFCHRKRTTDRVHRAQQRIGGGKTAATGRCQPLFNGSDVTSDFGLEYLEQHRIDRLRRHPCRPVDGIGSRRDVSRMCHRRRRVDICLHTRRVRQVVRCRGYHAGIGCHHRVAGRRLQPSLLTSGNAIGHRFDRLDIDGHCRRTGAQRLMHVRQCVARGIKQCHHCRRRLARAFQHAVQHILDTPGELTERQRAHQAATALERMEHPSNRAQYIQRFGIGTPCRQGLLEVLDFLLKLFEEHLANLVVDIIGCRFEARQRACARCCRNNLCYRHRWPIGNRLVGLLGNRGIGQRVIDRWRCIQRSRWRWRSNGLIVDIHRSREIGPLLGGGGFW